MKAFDFFVLAILIVVILAGVTDLLVTKPYVVQGQVIDLVHTPASTNTSIGYSDKPIVITTSVDEKWTVVLLVGSEVMMFDVAPDIYYSVQIGDYIEMTCRRGKMFGIVSCR